MSSSRLTLFICEFITGGGLCNVPLANSLVKEGTLMRDALLKDVMALDQFDVITTHDKRIGASTMLDTSIVVEQNFETAFHHAITQADIVWLIAPESDGILLDLSRQCIEAGVKLIGCDAKALEMTSNKLVCAEWLEKANIPVIPTISAQQWLHGGCVALKELSSALEQWVVKPIDGVGCEGIQLFDALAAMEVWLNNHDCAQHYLIQPYQPGIAASFSMVCKAGQACLLSCNQQHVSMISQTFRLDGITINGISQYWQQIERLAQGVAQILPGAEGYVGVDIIIDPTHDKISVIEINPRLTTSYVAMGEATGLNVAGLIVDNFLTEHFHCPVVQKNMVSIQI